MSEIILGVLNKMHNESDYEKWWRIMNIPLMNIPQEELLWAAAQDKFNSFCSKNGFLQEIERRKNL